VYLIGIIEGTVLWTFLGGLIFMMYLAALGDQEVRSRVLRVLNRVFGRK
jgi:hypothetical protein